jgi:hypothetical protein
MVGAAPGEGGAEVSGPKRWLVAGGNGMLGHDLQWVLGEAGAEVRALGHR